MAPTYGESWKGYRNLWDQMELTRESECMVAARTAINSKARYVAVADRFNKIHGTDLPWWMIPPIHMRESDFDFNTQLAQGDPLGQVSTHVPKGKGPYRGADAWERAAIEALEIDGFHKVKDWRLEKVLYNWEKYNGFGYTTRNYPSPYVWSGTELYEAKPSKFTSDGNFSAGTEDKQLGCAPVLKCMMRLDSTIIPRRESDTPDPIEPDTSIPEAIEKRLKAIEARLTKLEAVGATNALVQQGVAALVRVIAGMEPENAQGGSETVTDQRQPGDGGEDNRRKKNE